MADQSPQPLEAFEADLRREAAGLGIIPPLSPLEMARGPTAGNFLDLVARNPRGWGNASPALEKPLHPWERDPQGYLGEIRNLPGRPNDYMAPVAEAISPTLGGYGMGVAGAETAGSLGQRDWAGAAEAAAPLLAMALAPGFKSKGGPVAAAGERKGIAVFHGSPHDFDKFDASKIGTGEGVQAYGHGLYFAESPLVAETYKRDLARLSAAEQRAHDEAVKWLRSGRHGEINHRAQEQIDGALGDFQHFEKRTPSDNELAKYLEKGLDTGKGRMYEIRLNAEPEQFLDWDKPLSQQPAGAREALAKLATRQIEESAAAAGLEPRPVNADHVMKLPGSSFAPRRTQDVQALRDAGIPGIRYLDQGSRGKGEGSYNYVIFPGNEHLISIIKKYGIAGAATILGMSQGDVAKAMSQGDANFEADLRRQAIAQGIIEGTPLESVQAAPVDNYLRAAQAAQPGEGAKGKLQDRGFLDKQPPVIEGYQEWPPEKEKLFDDAIKPRVDGLINAGVPPREAYRIVRGMPDVAALRQRMGREGGMSDDARRLLEDVK